MELTAAAKKHFRSLGHKLKPVVIVGGKGINTGVEQELERALEDHELIKVKLNVPDPSARREMAAQLCEEHRASLVQAIGKIILIYRAANKPNPRLSNLLRPQ